MLRPRIIPCLLVHNQGLVKTVQFKNPRYVGDPVNAVRIFNEKDADELIVLDIDGTASNTEPDFRMIAQLAAECRMPLCYGGGIKTAAQAKRITRLGVEKVAVSSAAVENPRLLLEIALEVGSQSVVVVLDVRRGSSQDEPYQVWIRNGRQKTDRSLMGFAADAEALGVGEIVINSIDNDGMMKGYDLELAEAVRRATRLPMTVLGGAGSLEHIGQLIGTCGVIGAAAGSLFVFKGAYKAVLINYPSAAQKDALIQGALGR